MGALGVIKWVVQWWQYGVALTKQEKKETSFASNRNVYEPKCTYPILRIWLPLWLHIPIYM